MIVVLKRNSDKEHVEKLMQHFTDMGCGSTIPRVQIHLSSA